MNKEQKDNKDGHDFWDDHFEVIGLSDEMNEKVKQEITKKLQGKFDKLEIKNYKGKFDKLEIMNNIHSFSMKDKEETG